MNLFTRMKLIVWFNKRNTAKVLKKMKQTNQYHMKKRKIKFFQKVPHFYYEGEWVCFPATGFHGDYDFYDYIEDSPFYQEVEPIIEEKLKEDLGDIYGTLFCGREVLERKKELLWDLYGIKWYSRRELNITMRYD